MHKKHKVTLNKTGHSSVVLDVTTTETACGFTAHAAYLGCSSAYETRQKAIEQLCEAQSCAVIETIEE